MQKIIITFSLLISFLVIGEKISRLVTSDTCVDKSLISFQSWLDNYRKSNAFKRRKLKFSECIAMSAFLRIATYQEKCENKNIKTAYAWLDKCSRMWLDGQYTRYDTCYLYDLPSLMRFNYAMVSARYLVHYPECKIKNTKELLNKINKKTITEAKAILGKPFKILKNTKTKNSFDCKNFRRFSFFKIIRNFPYNLYKAYVVKSFAEKAVEKSEKLFPTYKKEGKTCSKLHNARGDAFRHCYWSCLITKKYTASVANKYTNFHEISPKNPCKEIEMDVHNNKIGIQIGTEKKDCESSCFSNQSLKILEDEKCY